MDRMILSALTALSLREGNVLSYMGIFVITNISYFGCLLS
jgi:hypothetical protein